MLCVVRRKGRELCIVPDGAYFIVLFHLNGARSLFENRLRRGMKKCSICTTNVTILVHNQRGLPSMRTLFFDSFDICCDTTIEWSIFEGYKGVINKIGERNERTRLLIINIIPIEYCGCLTRIYTFPFAVWARSMLEQSSAKKSTHGRKVVILKTAT